MCADDDTFHIQCANAEKKIRAALDAIDDGDVMGLISLIGHTHIDRRVAAGHVQLPA